MKVLVPIKTNITQLMGPIRSKARKRAILTIAKKHNISRNQAQLRQAIKIVQK